MSEREVASVSSERALRSVRAVTQNLWGRRGAWSERRAILIAGLRELQPDLIAFQEAIKNDECDQVRDLLGPDYHVLHGSKREAGDGGDVETGQGISIASRWPFRAAQELELPVTPRMAESVRASLMVEVHAPGPIGPLLFVNHNPSWQLRFEYERELQAVAVARALEDRLARQPMHAVLAGDLNADPEAASMRFLIARQALEGTSVCYRDAWESAHPDESGATKTFDKPLVRRLGLAISPDRPYRRALWRPWRPDSRHLPLRPHVRSAGERHMGKRPLWAGRRPRSAAEMTLSFALLGRGMSGVPHEVVGDGLCAPVERVKQRERPVGTEQRDGRIHLDHGQAPAGSRDGVAFPCVRLLPYAQPVQVSLEGGSVDDGGKIAVFVASAAGPPGCGDSCCMTVASHEK